MKEQTHLPGLLIVWEKKGKAESEKERALQRKERAVWPSAEAATALECVVGLFL